MFKAGSNMKITVKIALFFLIMSLISIASYLIINSFLSDQEEDAQIINLAGRERMLIQKMSKESLILATKQTSSNKDVQNLTATRKEFEQLLQALMNGNKKLEVPAMSSEETLQQLQKVDQLWQPFKANVQKIEKRNDPSGRALNDIVTTNEQLLSEMNKAVLLYGDFSRQKVKDVKFRLLISNLIIILFSIAGWWIFYFQIANPLKKLSAVANQVAKGDLTGENLYINRNDEVGILVKSFHQMVENLKVLISNIQQTTLQLASSSQQLNASAEMSSQSAEQVAAISQNSADKIAKQLNSVDEVSVVIHGMSTGIEQIKQNSEYMSVKTRETTQLTTIGEESVQEIVIQMKDIDNSIKTLNEIIQSLDDKSKIINNIVSIITAISDQTNLLALNAAIEAARAGEQGKGFAVVAEEVRKLAEQSGSSAKEITKMIQEVQQETTRAVNSIEESLVKVASGIETSRKVNISFKTIEDAIADVRDMVVNVTASVEQIAGASKNVEQEIETVKSAAQENAANGQESSAATEEQLASMQEISSSSQELASLADHLQQELHKFKV
ncbi:methyl-accepting chemotaxis protein [Neobacillus sp. SM06]|uniref:methyl-accepting chemotaxis protein n=1 Tax=Neobacillus sp. SM06 TaxID=3422492 RepID=UPI003D2CC666